MLKMTRRDNRDMIPRRIFELSHQGAAPLCVTERRYWAGDAEAGYGTVSFYTAQRHDGVHTLCLSGTQLRVSFERREDALCLLHAQLSTDPADVITLSDHNGNDVSVRPFTVRRSISFMQGGNYWGFGGGSTPSSLCQPPTNIFPFCSGGQL